MIWTTPGYEQASALISSLLIGYLTIILRNRAEYHLILSQLSVNKCAASFAIAFSWLSSHYENSGYLCELKQILVDFLRAFNRGKFLPGS